MKTVLFCLLIVPCVALTQECSTEYATYSPTELCDVIHEYDEVYNECLKDTGVLEGRVAECGYALEELVAQKYQVRSLKRKLSKANRVIRMLRNGNRLGIH